jgi:hypothetical protein
MNFTEAFVKACSITSDAAIRFVKDYSVKVNATTLTDTQKLDVVMKAIILLSNHPTDIKAIMPNLTLEEKGIAKEVAKDWIRAEIQAKRDAATAVEDEVLAGLDND